MHSLLSCQVEKKHLYKIARPLSLLMDRIFSNTIATSWIKWSKFLDCFQFDHFTSTFRFHCYWFIVKRHSLTHLASLRSPRLLHSLTLYLFHHFQPNSLFHVVHSFSVASSTSMKMLRRSIFLFVFISISFACIGGRNVRSG